MAHNTEEYILRLELAWDAGCWLFKHVSAAEKQPGDAQINDEKTNALLYLRRITLDEAKEIVCERMSNDTAENESLGIVILPVESKIVQALKRQKRYGNSSSIS